MHIEQVFNSENVEKNIKFLEYTRLDRYLNLEKEKENYKVLKIHVNNFSYFEITVSLF